MINNLLDILFASNFNLVVASVILILIIYAAAKRLFKILVLALTIFAFYCSFLLLNNEPLPTTEQITDQLTPDKDTQETIKGILENTENEIKKRYKDLNN